MKKWLSLIMAAMLVMSLTAMSAFAAELTMEDVVNGGYTLFEPDANGMYTVTYNNAALTEDSVALILVVKGLWSSTSDIELDAANNNVCYIYDAVVTTAGEVTFNGKGDGFGLMMSPDSTVVISGGGLSDPVIVGYIAGVGVPVSGTVNFIGGNAGRTATVYLTDTTDDSIVFETTVTGTGTTAKNHEFAFDTIPEGTYYLTAECEGHCDYKQAAVVTVGSEEITGLSGTLRPGDCNGNGRVDIGDLGMIIRADNFNKSIDKAAQPDADVNGNGRVDILDLGIVIRADNFNKGSYTK